MTSRLPSLLQLASGSETKLSGWVRLKVEMNAIPSPLLVKGKPDVPFKPSYTANKVCQQLP